MRDADTETLFKLIRETDRDARYEKAVKLLPKLAEKSYPMEKVIRILNRLGTVDDEGFEDLPAMKGKYRRSNMLGVYQRIFDGKSDTSFGIQGGEPLKKIMQDFGECLDSLLKDNRNDAHVVASFSILMLGDIHPFVEGNGRTSRLLMNYILTKLGLVPKNLDAELTESRLGELNEIKDYEIDPERKFGKTILKFSALNDAKIWKKVWEDLDTTIKEGARKYSDIKFDFLRLYIKDAKEGNLFKIPKVPEMSEIIRNLPNC